MPVRIKKIMPKVKRRELKLLNSFLKAISVFFLFLYQKLKLIEPIISKIDNPISGIVKLNALPGVGEKKYESITLKVSMINF